MKGTVKDNKGFTLIEVMVTMAISAIVMAGIYSIYTAQSTARRNQKVLLDMMQNLRAGIYYMEREIRVAGFDPTSLASAGIIRANLGDIIFTLDTNQNGTLVDGGGVAETGERIRYFLSLDADGDGIADAPGCNLMREESGVANVLSMNIEALQFFYFDENGVRLDDGGGNVAGNIGNIKTVQIVMVARGEAGQRGYTNSREYNITLVDGTIPDPAIYPAAGDSIQREILTTAVRCRNL